MNREKVGTRTHRVYSQKMDKWIRENATVIVYRNQKHFTDLFNAIHGTSITTQQMNQHLYRIGVQVSTNLNVDHYTDEMNRWLYENYSKYDNDWVALSNDFNAIFNVQFSNCRLAKHCTRKLKIHKPKKKGGGILNKGCFIKGVAGVSTAKQLPIGTIRIYSSGTSKIPMIKVKLCEGDSGILTNRRSHNFKRPWWIPLKEKVWIDANGEIPEGFTVVNLDNNQENCSLDNLAIANKRGLAIMGSHKWWSDNAKFTATAIEWCNLYMVVKDSDAYK